MADLAGRAGRGDEAAFAELVRAATDRLFRFLYRLTDHAQDAEDLVQETWLKAHRALARYDVGRPFLPWLFTIARRSVLNHRRAARPCEPLPEDLVLPSQADGPAEEFAERDDHAQLWEATRRLPPRYREVLWLYYGEGLDTTAAAAILRCTPLCVKVRLHRARRALLRSLQQAPSRAAPPNPRTAP